MWIREFHGTFPIRRATATDPQIDTFEHWWSIGRKFCCGRVEAYVAFLSTPREVSSIFFRAYSKVNFSLNLAHAITKYLQFSVGRWVVSFWRFRMAIESSKASQMSWSMSLRGWCSGRQKQWMVFGWLILYQHVSYCGHFVGYYELILFLLSVRFLPEWLPGMEFKRLAREWSGYVDDLANIPFKFVHDAVVRAPYIQPSPLFAN